MGRAAVSSVGSQSLIDRAYDELCRLEEAGERVTSTEFLARYPEIRESLAKLLEVHRGLAAESSRSDSRIAALQIGEEYRGFRLEAELGTGGFGRVFLATQPRIGHRNVVVKITRQGEAEAFTLGRIDHRFVTPVYSIDEIPGEGLSIICMPYLGCRTLKSLLERVRSSSAPPPDDAIVREAARDAFGLIDSPPLGDPVPYATRICRLFGEICEAVELLHTKKILHLDLKPSNILLRPDGSPLVLDFNLSRDAERQAGRFGGTYRYMSPEHLLAMADGIVGDPVGGDTAGGRAIDERSDVYALGTLLWECLTGRHPLYDSDEGVDSPDLIASLLDRQRQGFSAKTPDGWSVDPEIVAIVRRCLAPDRNDRPASAAALGKLLAASEIARPVPETSPATVSAPTSKRPRRWWIAASTVALMAIGSAAVVASRIAPTAIDDAYRRGAQAWKAGDHSLAYDEFTRVIEKNPNDARSWLARALASVTQPTNDTLRLARALADVQTAERIDPASARHDYHGYLLHLMRGGAPAPLYRQALEAGQSPLATRNNLAVFLAASTVTVKDALALLDEAIALSPNDPVVLYNRGFVRNKLATELFNPPVSPEDKAAYRSGALDDWRKALEVGPENAELHYALSQAVYKHDPLAAAWRNHLTRALDLGFDRKRFSLDPTWKSIRGQNEFRDFLDRPMPAEATNATQPRLIAPLTELPTWR